MDNLIFLKQLNNHDIKANEFVDYLSNKENNSRQEIESYLNRIDTRFIIECVDYARDNYRYREEEFEVLKKSPIGRFL